MIAQAIIRIAVGIALMGLPFCFLQRALNRLLAQERAQSKAPFATKMLRPPGESLRLKIGEIEQSILDRAVYFVFPIVLPGFIVMQLPVSSVSGWIIVAISIPAASFAFIVPQWRKMRKLRKELRNYRLGFDGERYVAAELSPLVAQGFRVFHDFQVDFHPGGGATTYNIDHIAVGPPGVFAIETKTRRKPLKPPPGFAGKSHEVFTSGSSLEYPQGSDRKSVPQAQRAAKELSAWLKGRSETGPEVIPVLALPGWSVQFTATPSPIDVFSGRNIAQRFAKFPDGLLSKSEINRIADHIENHCRDIDLNDAVPETESR